MPGILPFTFAPQRVISSCSDAIAGARCVGCHPTVPVMTNSAAAPSPTIPGTFSVPLQSDAHVRMPPSSCGTRVTARIFLRQTTPRRLSVRSTYAPIRYTGQCRVRSPLALKFANGLRGITEEERAAFVGKFRQFPNGLEDAGLVVRQHDRDQDRIVAQYGTEQFRIQSSVRLDRQTGDLAPSRSRCSKTSSTARCSVVQVMKCRPLD